MNNNIHHLLLLFRKYYCIALLSLPRSKRLQYQSSSEISETSSSGANQLREHFLHQTYCVYNVFIASVITRYIRFQQQMAEIGHFLLAVDAIR